MGKLTEGQIEQIIRRYEAGESTCRLAPHFDVSPKTIERILKRRGLLRSNRKLTATQINEACQRYKAGESSEDIAKDLGVWGTSIRRWLRYYGVTMRSPSQARPRMLSDAQIQQVCQRYQAGDSSLTLGEQFGVSPTTITNYLREQGIIVRSMQKLNEQQIEEACKAYEEGDNIYSIGAELDVSGQTIWRHLKHCGVPTRSLSEVARRHSCNHHFFTSIDAEDRAYWLGFLAADGCVYNNGLRLSLQYRDRPHIARFLEALNSDYVIGDRQDCHGRTYCSVTIYSTQLTDDLRKQGIVERKTYKLRWPDIVPDSLLRHYLRGYMDGDGGLYPARDSDGRPNLCFMIAGTRDLLEGAQAFLMATCQLRKTKLYSTPSVKFKDRETCKLRYGGRRQVSRIWHLLYDDATIYLPRKKKKIEKFIIS